MNCPIDRRLPSSLLPWIGLGLSVLGLAGFGCGGGSHQQYVPAESRAREAVEATLNAWKSAQPEGDARTISEGVKVNGLDQDWRSGKVLSDFTILEALAAVEHEPRQFRVRLNYAGETNPVETVYFVVGIDPLWVFREEDYRRTGGG